jgi:hypothetical protein
MPTIMHLAWQESMIVDGYLPPFPGSHGAVTEQTLHPVNSIDT